MNTPQQAGRGHPALQLGLHTGPGLPTASGGVRVAVLGPLVITGAACCLQPRQAELLVALALAGTAGLSNEALRAVLGEDPDHPKPPDSVRQVITRTRRRLGIAPCGGEYIIQPTCGVQNRLAGNAQYTLAPEASLDWDEFRTLARAGRAARDRQPLRDALALLRGHPFEGLYYWWLDGTLIDDVRAEIADTAATLASLELDAGQPGDAGRAARAGLAVDMSAEHLWRAVMRAEDAMGNTPGVHEAWRRCLDAIADVAADGQPHRDTTRLYRELTGTTRLTPRSAPARTRTTGNQTVRRGLAS